MIINNPIKGAYTLVECWLTELNKMKIENKTN